MLRRCVLASLFSLVQNCALLALASSVLFVLENHFAWLAAGMRRRAVTGLVFGLIPALVVLSPIPGPFGASFDTRAGPLVLAGYLGGPVGGLIAASLAGIARADVGGAAVVGTGRSDSQRRWAGLPGPLGGLGLRPPGVCARHSARS